MSSSSDGSFLVLHALWSITLRRGHLRLTHRNHGTTLDFEGREVKSLATTLRRKRLISGAALSPAVKGMLPDLMALGVLRSADGSKTTRVVGRTPLADIFRKVASVPGETPLTIDVVGNPWHGSNSEVFAFGLGRQMLVAARLAHRPCSRCLLLRVLGRTGRPGIDQTAVIDRGELCIVSSKTQTLALELLVELALRPLGVDEVVVVSRGKPLQRGTLVPHPDCERCQGTRAISVRESVQRFEQALGAGRARASADLQRNRAVYAQPGVGPIEIVEEPGGPKTPFGLPFVWGSVFLSRAVRGRVCCTSTYGGLYGSAASAEMSRLLATSEGAERLGARGARPTRWGPPTAHNSIPLDSLYGGTSRPARRASRAWCLGVELTKSRPVFLPWESVVVALPSVLYPEAAHREPFYSGAASHQTLTEALVHGAVEILKRDAFMISWYRRRRLSAVRWPSVVDSTIGQRARYLKQAGLSIELFELTLQLPLPMLLLRLTAEKTCGNWPAGGSMLIPCGGFTPAEALAHGLNLACGQFLSLAAEPRPFKNPLDLAAVRRLTRRLPTWALMARYLDPRHRKAHQFLDGAPMVAFEHLKGFAVETPREKFELLKTWLSEAQLPWVGVRLTDEVAQAAGFEVAKSVIPGLIAIAPSRASANLRMPRLSRDWPGATIELNPDPHPLY